LTSHTHVSTATTRATIGRLNIGNFKQFQKSEKIKQVALMAIAVQSDPNDIQELKDIFVALDRDGNGSISL